MSLDYCLYAAVTILGWSREDFWRSSPRLISDQLREYKKAHSGKRAIKKVRYVDELQGGW